MKPSLLGVAGALAATLLFSACTEAPVTGRSQLMLVGEQQANSMGLQAWQMIRTDMKVSQDASAQRLVKRIGTDIVAKSGAPAMDWEFLVFDNPEPNAFALPGGKIGMHSGMLNIARSEDEIAAILAHEVAHVVARHPAEQMSQDAAIQTVLAATGITEGAVGQLARMATGIGQLKFSRDHESEADRIGLEYMARAGYDPRAAVTMWERMQQAAANVGRPPQFLSTHPHSEGRIAAIEAALPQVMPIYQANR